MGGCQSGRKAVPHNSKSDLPLVSRPRTPSILLVTRPHHDAVFFHYTIGDVYTEVLVLLKRGKAFVFVSLKRTMLCN